MFIKEIINEEKINEILEKTKSPSDFKIHEILGKAREKKGLNLEEVGYLLNTEKQELIKEILKISSKIKKDIYGERLVFFAPLYVSNFCINDCEYCGFHSRNNAVRKKLTLKEVEEQVKIIEDMGHKRLLLEFGEHPNENPIEYVLDVIKTIYKTKSGKGEIRRVNVNIAATSVRNYKKLKKACIGTYQLFQETYHKATYEKVHKGPKADYKRQLFAHNKALKAGIDDIGLGVLFGLYDYKFEVLSLVSHAQYLDKKFNVGPHTFSVPRFKPANSVTFKPQYVVSNNDFLKIIAILRIAVPYTGMILSTREKPEIREKAFEIGISQTSAASKASPGGYGRDEELSQFSLSDNRNVEEVLKGILKQNLLPSFCTACYRKGRTGKNFMDLAKPGKIQELCRPNAILTFKEYLEDYASEDLKKIGLQIINKYLKQISDRDIKRETEKKLKKIEKGGRDLFF